MNKDMSETLTRVGPGTPMGQLMRRYWVPALMSSEIAEPDGPQVRVQIMGERLLAFRDTSGAVGLVAGQCRTDVRPSVEQQWHDGHVRADGGCQGVRHGASRGKWAAGVR